MEHTEVKKYMKYSTILFDMDGTLLPMRQDEFVKAYFVSISKAMEPLGYEMKKLTDTIIKGTFAMVKGDGTRPNECIFWEVFCGEYGDEAIKHKPLMDSYYEDSFDELKIFTSLNSRVKVLIDKLKENGTRLVLATNPLFPPKAIEKRLSWAGISFNDFELCTTYENSSYCKPNPKYYTEILNKLNLNAKDCIMVGNDVDDDMVASEAGLDVYLITDSLINRHNKDISVYKHGSFDEFIDYILEKEC